MQNTIKIEKVTINFGAGKDQHKLEKGMKLIKHITGKDAVKTLTQKRIPGWGLRPNLPIGAKLTLRGTKAKDIVSRMLYAKDNVLQESNFDNNGNVSFGVPEYIDIKDAQYDPELGILGMEIAVTLTKPGKHVKLRSVCPRKIGKRQRVTKDDAISFMKDKFKVQMGE